MVPISGRRRSMHRSDRNHLCSSPGVTTFARSQHRSGRPDDSGLTSGNDQAQLDLLHKLVSDSFDDIEDATDRLCALMKALLTLQDEYFVAQIHFETIFLPFFQQLRHSAAANDCWLLCSPPQLMLRGHRTHVAAQNKRQRKEDQERLVKIDALKEGIQNMAPNGDSAEQDATRLQALKEWESRTTVDFGMLQLWPVLPRTWAALKVLP
ncbi:unnamed protein product [Jaminaea pallidilutea]